MARKTTTTTIEDEANADKREEIDDLDSDTDVLRALTELEGSDDIRWQIYRLSEPNKGYITEISTAELTLERIAECGPGRYKVRGIKEDGRYFKSRTITIAKKPESENNSLLEFMEKSKNGDMHALQFMTLLMNQQQAQQQNMTQVLVAALGRDRDPKRPEIPWGAIVSAIPPSLVALKEFFANKADPIKQMTDVITLTEKLREGGDRAGTTWPDLIKEGLSTIPATLQSLKGSPSDPGVQTRVETRTVPPPPPPPPVQTPEAIAPPLADSAMNLQLLSWMRDMISQLLKAATRNANPELYAELFVDELPESISDQQVLSLLSADDWWQKLSLFDSRIVPYEHWFAQLRESLLMILQSDGETPNDRSEHDGTDSGEIQESTDSNGADA